MAKKLVLGNPDFHALSRAIIKGDENELKSIDTGHKDKTGKQVKINIRIIPDDTYIMSDDDLNSDFRLHRPRQQQLDEYGKVVVVGSDIHINRSLLNVMQQFYFQEPEMEIALYKLAFQQALEGGLLVTGK